MNFILVKEDIIQNIDFKESFEQLSEDEKNYLYYLTKACWAGQPIVLFQTSYESPALFIIFQLFFSSFKDLSEIKAIFLKNNIAEANYNNFINYAATFYSCFGNYKLKKKFIPALNIEDFETILKLSTNFKDINSIWDIIKYIIYDDSENISFINLEEKNGKNSYYFGGLKKDEILKIDDVLKKNNFSLINTRLFMLNSSKVVTIGSVEEKQITLNDEIILLYGEFSSFFKKINEYLENAKNITTKDTEKELINSYINFFKGGDIKIHKECQKKWVKDKTSSIDFNMGWNEGTIDPLGVRGSFESFVGIADNFRSQKYEQFVNLLPQFISELPWDENFEKEYNLIQINSIEEICVAGNGSCYGKCLPKYYDIKEQHGVKNILFFNACPNFKYKNDEFFICDEKDIELINNFGKTSTKIIVSIKQLIGYGTGKLLRVIYDKENNKEESNFNRDLINPLTEKVIDKFYVNYETFEEKFTNIAPVLDECRALLIGLYFCGNESIQEIFYVNKIDYKNVTYTIWILQFSWAIFGLHLYNEKNKTWGHPYSQALWVVIKYIFETQKEGEEILKLNYDEEKENIKIQLNKEMVLFSAKDLLSKLMLKLHIWKCTGDVEEANKCLEHYSEVDEKFLKIKKVVDSRLKAIPGNLFLYHNLIRDEEDGTISYKEYKQNLEGIIESNVDRFGTEYNKDIYAQWVKYATNFIKEEKTYIPL
jgi:dipeptidyl-peptidase-3